MSRAIVLALLGLACTPAGEVRAPAQDITVRNSFPHDPRLFTQGLVYADGFLYESAGGWGISQLVQSELATGVILRARSLPPDQFAEGLARSADALLQLTLDGEVGFIYDLATLEARGAFRFSGPGWGLTHSGEHLIASDGSCHLQFWDPTTFELVRKICVRDGNQAIEYLNELEWMKGEVLANVWGSDRIARIAPDSGSVLGWIELAGLLPPGVRAKTNVLNGIAHDAHGDRLFVTGKHWPQLFEIALTQLP